MSSPKICEGLLLKLHRPWSNTQHSVGHVDRPKPCAEQLEVLFRGERQLETAPAVQNNGSEWPKQVEPQQEILQPS